MPSKNDVHTVPNPKGGWSNKVNGVAVSNHETKQVAQDAGRDIARRNGSEHYIHNKDGTISERNSYGNDPRSSKG
ncbi:DUF2188 domain-containing protein [Polyangium mundeleinium]|uniref:DUF2188 domain-containing protein n=1 Tax=Polyangium mundeleinium TaxID=2995306 RepID=A0ABT5EGK5_9BACT|nr:DUF2188 domain-containing protein [Polyangium mundeleinium]MDC0740955.1 DUF2188 domain-containing protein [Polyangium mundeleinium]